MKSLRWCLLCATVLLTGCVSQPPPQVASPPPPPPPKMVWDKAGATRQSFAIDQFDCIRQSQVMVMINGTGGQITKWPLYNVCMEARGWALVPEKTQ
jgi:hypothetical protein